MKVTIYTITDCPFCKAEKDYLKERGIVFDEKNLESNKAYLPEMLEASDKFAGVPFTTVTKDDGSVIKLRGFTKEEFDENLMDKAVTKPSTNQMGMGDMNAKSAPSDAVKPDQFNPSMSPTAPVAVAPTQSTPPTPTPMNNPVQGLTPNFGQTNPQSVASPVSSSSDTTAPSMSTASQTTGNDQSLTANPAVTSSPTSSSSGGTNPAQQLDSLLASLRSQNPPSAPTPPLSPVAGQATSQVDTNTTNQPSSSIN